ncbi:DUF4198 domain-containing protein [Hymenobacter cellulosivorans]|uniref:DUF4198 domain-containing protein n=1 Tax=Hymenobacter cellulosivorans TaxID=2932249 RepID=A0ABY4F9G7_9BACT|nr:DUF4198 domain-containing protein [Hymenobacter cellulosivorans]UOQ52589.1 DUF4198 domain-containing protein [Hymenobacter cellulosivorans]
MFTFSLYPVLGRLRITALLFLVGATTTLAREFWLLPPHFFVVPGTRINLHVFVGDNFIGSRWPGKSSRLTSFVHYAPTDTVDLTKTATEQDTLSTSVEVIQLGVHLLAFSTNSAFTELDAEQFNAYLKENGLERVSYLRQQRGETTKPGRELYRRCAKSLVQVGPAGLDTSRVHRWVTGQPLEIIPEQNPYALRPGASLTCLVLYKGQPLPATLVQVWQRTGGQSQVIKLYTNKNGRVLFRLNSPGNYMVSSVYMETATDRKAADWQSTWATLTFGMAGRNTK